MRKHERPWQIASWVLVAAVAVLSGFNVRSAIIRSRALTPPDALLTEWQEYAAVGQWIGPPTAPVTIVSFSDYQCAACRQFENALGRLREQYADSVAAVVRHLPLGKHAHAVPAARAAICAGAQGRFMELNSLLFEVQDSLGRIPWRVLATRAGVADMPAFQSCLEDAATDVTLRRDFAAAERLGTSTTPTLLVGSRLYRGVPSDLERIVAQAMEDYRATPRGAARPPTTRSR